MNISSMDNLGRSSLHFHDPYSNTLWVTYEILNGWFRLTYYDSLEDSSLGTISFFLTHRVGATHF